MTYLFFEMCDIYITYNEFFLLDQVKDQVKKLVRI